MVELIKQALFSGVLNGASYALIALGLVIVFGTMHIINLAHGELVLLAAYVAYMMESSTAIGWIFAIPVALIIVCITGLIIYYLINKIKSNRELNSLLLTYGVAFVLTNSILLIWKSDIHSTSITWFQEGVMIGSVFSMRSELIFFILSLGLLFLVWLWLSKSWHGRAVRAVASNRDAAKLMGINPSSTEKLSFLVASILATFAGIAAYTTNVIEPSLGHFFTIKAFIITVLAGTGSIPGVLIGAMLIGIVESMTVTLFSSSLQELAGMVLFLVVLFVLPTGLFGRRA